MADFDDEDGGGLLDAFEKGNNIPSAVSRKRFAVKDSSESEISLHQRAASRKGSVTEESLESGSRCRTASREGSVIEGSSESDLGRRVAPQKGSQIEYSLESGSAE
jgi:hypothetical protein